MSVLSGGYCSPVLFVTSQNTSLYIPTWGGLVHQYVLVHYCVCVMCRTHQHVHVCVGFGEGLRTRPPKAAAQAALLPQGPSDTLTPVPLLPQG